MTSIVGALGLGAVAGLAGCPFDTELGCENAGVGCPEVPEVTAGSEACPGDPTQDATLVREECGVFVSASAEPGGDGTREKPFHSLAEAVRAASAPEQVGIRNVYACAEEYAEAEGVTARGGIEIYGGFVDCAGAWSWSATRRALLRGPADAVALTLEGGDSRVTNLDVVAASATIPGGSSIAVVASGGTLTWQGGEITAGDAMAGVAGEELGPDDTLSGEDGAAGEAMCNAAASNPGAEGKTKLCATGGISVGGDGGDGGVLMGSTAMPAGDGANGEPAYAEQPAAGLGGAGEDATACEEGTNGAAGADGAPGAGATGTGTISASGYAGGDGAPGMSGLPGQGGGGGGGAKGDFAINCTGSGSKDRVGASGGAGGTGGCGGAGGGGGQAGGASIAMVVVDAAVTLERVRLAAGKGGAGGKGGNGQYRGRGGASGAGGLGEGTASNACAGGAGGDGGTGGPGGGGQGGHSLGIAFQGSTPPVGGEPVIDPQLAGPGGDGGTGNTAAAGGKGADGVGAGCWDFAANAACGG